MKKTSAFRVALRAGLTCPAVFVAGIAAAQTDKTTDSAQASGGLEQIVVTARRVEENVQRVPVTLVAVTPEQLERADVTDINSLQKIVPGYTGGARYVGSSIATNTYRIRGLTGIATYFGDVPVDFSNYGVFFDIENVQALMGPQGTLFGRASNAGALVITPRAPGNELGGYVRAEVGNAGREVYEGAVDIPLLDDKVLVRVAAKSYFVEGYLRDIFSNARLGETNYDVARVNLLVRPTDSFENQTIFQIERDKNIGSAPFAIHDFNMSSAFNATAQRQATANGMTLAQFNAARDYVLALQDQIGPYRLQGSSLGCPATANSPVIPSRIPGPNIADVIPTGCPPSRGWQQPAVLINKTTWEFAEGLSVKNIFGARWLKQRDGLANSDNTRLLLRDTNPKSVRTYGTTLSDFGDWTDELQLVGSNLFDDRLDFVAGYFHSRARTPHLEPVYAQYSFNLNDVVTAAYIDDKTNAVYGQLDFDLTDRLTLTAGLRQTWDHSIRTNYVLNPTTLAVTSVRGGPGTPDGEGKWDALSYTVGARYQLNPDTMFFITNSKGHSSGGLQNVAGNEKFNPDSLNNIEVGLKTTFDLGSAVLLRTNVAAHYGWFDDVKVAQLILTTIPGTTGTTFVTATTNAAKAKVKGADLDVTAVIVDDFELTANVNYAKNDYTEYTSLDANTGAVIDLSNTPFPNNPEWKYSFSATYHLPIDTARFGDISVGVDYTYADEHWAAVGGECKTRRTAANGYGPLSADGSMAYKNCVPEWHNVNAQISWDEPLGYAPLRATLSVSNLTQYDGPTGVGTSYNSSGFSTFYPNPPRYVYLSLRHEF